MFSAIVPLPNALCHFVKLSPVIFDASFFAYASRADAFALPSISVCKSLDNFSLVTLPSLRSIVKSESTNFPSPITSSVVDETLPFFTFSVTKSCVTVSVICSPAKVFTLFVPVSVKLSKSTFAFLSNSALILAPVTLLVVLEESMSPFMNAFACDKVTASLSFTPSATCVMRLYMASAG